MILIQNLNSSFTPSQADNTVFEALGTAPPGDLFHAVRFFNHINSFSTGERKAWPAAKGTTAPAAKPAAKDDDDDVDLFGSDEEEDAAAAKIREERLAMYAAKKSNSTFLNFLFKFQNKLFIEYFLQNQPLLLKVASN